MKLKLVLTTTLLASALLTTMSPQARTLIQNKGSDTLVNVAQAWAEAYPDRQNDCIVSMPAIRGIQEEPASGWPSSNMCLNATRQNWKLSARWAAAAPLPATSRLQESFENSRSGQIVSGNFFITRFNPSFLTSLSAFFSDTHSRSRSDSAHTL